MKPSRHDPRIVTLKPDLYQQPSPRFSRVPLGYCSGFQSRSRCRAACKRRSERRCVLTTRENETIGDAAEGETGVEDGKDRDAADSKAEKYTAAATAGIP